MRKVRLESILSEMEDRPVLRRAVVWLMDRLSSSLLGTGGWVSASEIEQRRAWEGVSKASLRTARAALLNKGVIEKKRHGFRGPWMYRLVEPRPLHCPVCGSVTGMRQRVPVEQIPVPLPEDSDWGLRYIGRRQPYVGQLKAEGIMWHGYGDIQPVADGHKARSLAQGHPDLFELVEIKPDGTWIIYGK